MPPRKLPDHTDTIYFVSVQLNPPCHPTLQAERTLLLPEYWGREHLVNITTDNSRNSVTDIYMYFLGVAELLIFHPVDTVAKRLMSNKAKVHS